MNKEFETILKDILGDPLPEIDPIYREGINFFSPGSVREDFVPYVMHEFYTVDEMRMMIVLPGTAEEIAAKTGFDEAFIVPSLDALVKKGRAIYSNGKYLRVIPNSAMYMDFPFWSLDGQGVEWNKKQRDFIRLMYHEQKPAWEFEPGTLVRKKMRVVPKLEAIRDIPGVMDCENIHTIFSEQQQKGTMCSKRCVCAVMSSMWADGQYPGKKEAENNYIDEGCCPADGHCFQFGPLGKYMIDVLNMHQVTEDDVEKKIQELEAKNLVYLATNSRFVDSMCCCDFDYCFPFSVNSWEYIPSRFKVVHDLNKCVNCGKCMEICQFRAIWKRGKRYIIDPEMCRGCGNCVVFCAANAKEMEVARPIEWVPAEAEAVKM